MSPTTGEHAIPAEGPDAETSLRLTLPTVLSLLALMAAPVEVYVTVKITEDRQVRQEERQNRTDALVDRMAEAKSSQDTRIAVIEEGISQMRDTLNEVRTDVKDIKRSGVVQARGHGL